MIPNTIKKEYTRIVAKVINMKRPTIIPTIIAYYTRFIQFVKSHRVNVG